MKKVTLTKGKNHTDILIDRYKLFIGNNYQNKFDLIQMMRSLNRQNSEYVQENNDKVSLKINDELVGTKSYVIYEVNTNFNFDVDLKLGTKSLSYQFLMNKLMEDVHFDTINTLNILLESLQNDINDNMDVKIIFDEMNPKLLSKFTTLSLLKNELIANGCDFSYEEFILQQLNLLLEISKKTLNDIFVVMDIPIVTKKIMSMISKFKKSYFMIFANDYHEISELKHIYLMDEYNVDLADEQLVYELYGERGGRLLTMEELNAYMIKALNMKNLRTVRFIKEMLQQQ